MSIVFDEETKDVFVQSKDSKVYFLTEGTDTNKTTMFYRMKMMYDLGKQHRSDELRKALGV
jgi:hypothetical protein